LSFEQTHLKLFLPILFFLKPPYQISHKNYKTNIHTLSLKYKKECNLVALVVTICIFATQL
jgi:hypothetical protein